MHDRMLPECWEVKKLGEVAEYINGRAFKPKEWSKKGLPIIRIQNLTKSTNKVNYYNGKYEEKYFVKNGDILLAWSATLDIFDWNEGPALLNQHIFNVKVNKKIVNKSYFFYYIKHIIDKIKNRTHGTGMTHITKPMLLSMDILIPHLSTQQKIVSKLDAFFKHYNKLKEEKQKAKKNYEKILQSTIAGLISKKEVPDDWNKDKLVNLCSKKPQYGYTATSVKEKIGPVYLRITDIDFKGNIDWNKIKYVKVSNEEHKKFKMDKGDIIVARTGATVGKSYLYNEEKNAIFASYLIRFRADTELILPEYLFIFMQSSLYWSHISKEQSGTGQPNVNAQKLGNLEVIYPKNIKSQKLIIERISDLKNVINIIEKEQKFIELQLSQLPKSVLSKAFKGEMM